MTINYGFKDISNNVWPNSLVDTYNIACEQVSKRMRYVNYPTDSLSYKELSFYRDVQHQTFIACMELASYLAKQQQQLGK